MSDIVLIDAYSQIFRVFYAIRMLNDASGRPTNAVFGMARLLMQIERHFPSEYGAIVFDKGKAVKRVSICPEYKAQRPPMPEQLREQIEPIMGWMEAFGWPCIMEEGLEADDIIAAIARRRGDRRVVIVTHDKDIAQLTADAGVELQMPEAGDVWKKMDGAATAEKFGLPVGMLGDYLALVGDTADNIAGVSGVGPKTAIKLLTEQGGLDGLLAHPEAVMGGRCKMTRDEVVALLERNRRLVALDDVLPAGCSVPGSLVRKAPDWRRIEALARECNFNSLLKEIAKQLEASEKKAGYVQDTFF